MARKKNIIPVLERTQVLATTCSSRSTVLVCIKFSTKLVITRNFSTSITAVPGGSWANEWRHIRTESMQILFKFGIFHILMI